MAGQELTGNYTYRSYLDLPEPVDDFNRLRFAELDLRLSVDSEGIITGALVLSDSPGAEPLTMEINGQVSEGSSPPHFNYTGQGRAGTPIADFHYEYDGIILRHWQGGVDQRLTLAGTVLRAADHGSGPTLARAGQTASFLAVKRDARA